MEATVEEINSVQRRVKVSVKAENVNKAFAEAYRQLQGKASIKGFRKGKVPINIIKKVYQQNAAAEVADKLIKEHLFAAIEQNQIRPIASPALESVDLPRHDEQYSFSAIVDVMPAMTLGNYKGLKVKVDIPKVTSSTVDKEIETLQKNHAKTKVVAGDQAARPGNLAHVSQTATLDGEPCPALAFTRTAVEVGAGHLLPAIDQAIVGMHAGEEKDITIELPADFPDQKIAGRTVQGHLKLEDLQELVLPNLDDEFAKDLGLPSLADLRQRVEQQFKSQAEQVRRQNLEKALLDQIIASHPFEVPPTLVDSVIDDLINQMRWRSEEEKRKSLRNAEFRKGFIDTAKRRAQNTLLLWEVAKLEELKVEDADIDAHLEKMFAGQDTEPEKKQELLAQMRQAMGKNLRENLIFEKALDYLISAAKITEVQI